MAKFTSGNIKGIHNEFKELCKAFAEKHGVKLVDSKLRYSKEELKFTIDMRSEDSGNNEFNDISRGIESITGFKLEKGITFTQGRSTYEITGGVNPRNSKYKIEALVSSKNEKTYFTIDGLIEAIKRGIIK